MNFKTKDQLRFALGVLICFAIAAVAYIGIRMKKKEMQAARK